MYVLVSLLLLFLILLFTRTCFNTRPFISTILLLSFNNPIFLSSPSNPLHSHLFIPLSTLSASFFRFSFRYVSKSCMAMCGHVRNITRVSISHCIHCRQDKCRCQLSRTGVNLLLFFGSSSSVMSFFFFESVCKDVS